MFPTGNARIHMYPRIILDFLMGCSRRINEHRNGAEKQGVIFPALRLMAFPSKENDDIFQ